MSVLPPCSSRGPYAAYRQTLITNKLAPGALIAWRVPNEQLQKAFDWMFEQDPFSGHVVIHTTDSASTGSQYRLWTTLKVPQGFSMRRHCELLCRATSAIDFRVMPAKKIFALGVGHLRRRSIRPGTKSDAPARIIDTDMVPLDDLARRVLVTLKREFELEEIGLNPWHRRAQEAGMELETFLGISRDLDRHGVIGRFSTFLEHVKKHRNGTTVTKYNALFHWAVPSGREIESGREVGRHHCITHAYWREGCPEFHQVNVMGVVHGTD